MSDKLAEGDIIKYCRHEQLVVRVLENHAHAALVRRSPGDVVAVVVGGEWELDVGGGCGGVGDRGVVGGGGVRGDSWW